MWSICLVIPLVLALLSIPWRIRLVAALDLFEGRLAFSVRLWFLPKIRFHLALWAKRFFVAGRALSIGKRDVSKPQKPVSRSLVRFARALRFEGDIGVLLGAGYPHSTALLVAVMGLIPQSKVRFRTYCGNGSTCKCAARLVISASPLGLLSRLIVGSSA